jgi:hypothetical protein
MGSEQVEQVDALRRQFHFITSLFEIEIESKLQQDPQPPKLSQDSDLSFHFQRNPNFPRILTCHFIFKEIQTFPGFPWNT